jgi:hypothetical protein
MTGLEALQSVQFVKKNGTRYAVLRADEWESLIDWLETLEDIQIVRQSLAHLKTAKGNRARAGWRKWEAVRKQLA